MGQTMINKDGQTVVLPFEQVTGQQIKEYAGITPERLVTVVENGQTRVIGDQERVTLAPGAFVSDAPRFVYGGTDRVEVVLSEADYVALKAHLLRDDDPREHHAFLFAGLCDSPRGRRLLVREIAFARPQDYVKQTCTYIELDPSYYLAATDRCRAEDLHLIECHSHPFTDQGVTFSSLDVENEREKFAWYAEKFPVMHAATLVFGHGSVDGHWYDPDRAEIRPLTGVRVVGPHGLTVLPATSAQSRPAACSQPTGDQGRFHRQALAFGQPGQERLAGTRVGIVGCGGLGSVFCQQLAYLGVRDFVLVDPDRVEETNLNRLIFAHPEDAKAHCPKVEVMARGIAAIRPGVHIEPIQGSVAECAVRERLKDVDLLIAGTDCDGARLVCNELAVRYLLPYLDAGTGLTVRESRVQEAGGQSWLNLPGGPCLECLGVIDPYRARVGLMDTMERARHLERGYGTETSQPSVLFLNAALASLAVGELVKLITGLLPPQGLLLYDALQPSVQSVQPPAPNPNCPVCHRRSLYGRGDEPGVTAFVRPLPLACLTPVKEPGALS